MCGLKDFRTWSKVYFSNPLINAYIFNGLAGFRRGEGRMIEPWVWVCTTVAGVVPEDRPTHGGGLRGCWQLSTPDRLLMLTANMWKSLTMEGRSVMTVHGNTTPGDSLRGLRRAFYFLLYWWDGAANAKWRDLLLIHATQIPSGECVCVCACVCLSVSVCTCRWVCVVKLLISKCLCCNRKSWLHTRVCRESSSAMSVKY